MRRVVGFVVAACAAFTWLGASGSQASAAPVAPGSSSIAGSAMCVAVKGVPYGYCLPNIKLPKLGR
jgi:hypothetical protein